MLIVCPNCATSYRVETSSLGATGRSVRCVRCRNVWFVCDPAPLAAIAQAHRADVEAFTGADSEAEYLDQPEAANKALPQATQAAAQATQAAPDATAPDAEPSPEPATAESATFDAEEPSAIDDGPTPAPEVPAVMENEAAAPAAAPPREDIETFAARRRTRHARRGSRWAVPALPLAILALFALDAMLIAWRTAVVKAAPQTASLYASIGLPVNVRGLLFTDVATTTETQDGVLVLVVEGNIASTSTRVVEVPRLRFSVRNPSGHEIYAWTALPARSLLAPGETLAFRSRLASPPPDARDVLVRFFNRRDVLAGIQ
jgi:predicted Zn finger-like uncharacterized protein